MKLSEINTKAAELKATGKTNELCEYAKKIGLTEDDAGDYIDGMVEELATATYLAGSIIETQGKSLECKGVVKDWVQTITQMAQNDTALANDIIEHDDKDLTHCLAEIISFSFENKTQVDSKIVDVTMITHNGKKEKLRGPLYLGVPSRAELQKIVHKYYGGDRR